MCRYSAGGTFNIPFGKYASVELPVNKILAVSAVIKDWHMSDMDFRTTMAQLNPGDVAYCDPPYVPEQQVKQATAFTAYSKENFSIDDQISLANAAGAAAQRGVTIIISNHDTKFTRNLYEERGGVLVKTRTKRSIASKSENRKEASELLVVFRPNSRNRPSRSRLKMHEYPADVKSEINDVIYRTESESALEIEPEE
jgi:DNA adenine methylase